MKMVGKYRHNLKKQYLELIVMACFAHCFALEALVCADGNVVFHGTCEERLVNGFLDDFRPKKTGTAALISVKGRMLRALDNISKKIVNLDQTLIGLSAPNSNGQKIALERLKIVRDQLERWNGQIKNDAGQAIGELTVDQAEAIQWAHEVDEGLPDEGDSKYFPEKIKRSKSRLKTAREREAAFQGLAGGGSSVEVPTSGIFEAFKSSDATFDLFEAIANHQLQRIRLWEERREFSFKISELENEERRILHRMGGLGFFAKLRNEKSKLERELKKIKEELVQCQKDDLKLEVRDGELKKALSELVQKYSIAVVEDLRVLSLSQYKDLHDHAPGFLAFLPPINSAGKIDVERRSVTIESLQILATTSRGEKGEDMPSISIVFPVRNRERAMKLFKSFALLFVNPTGKWDKSMDQQYNQLAEEIVFRGDGIDGYFIAGIADAHGPREQIEALKKRYANEHRPFLELRFNARRHGPDSILMLLVNLRQYAGLKPNL